MGNLSSLSSEEQISVVEFNDFAEQVKLMNCPWSEDMGQQAGSVTIQRTPAQINVSCTDLKSRKINFVNSNLVAIWLIDEMMRMLMIHNI